MIERGLGTENAAVVHVWQYQASLSCPDCSRDAVVLRNVTFGADSNCECTAATSITIGPDVTTESGASVIFKAPVVKIESGLVIERGAVVHVGKPNS